MTVLNTTTTKNRTEVMKMYTCEQGKQMETDLKAKIAACDNQLERDVLISKLRLFAAGFTRRYKKEMLNEPKGASV